VVTTRQPSDVSDPIKLVAAGRVDLGISYEPELFFAQQHHAPVVAVSAIVPTALNSVIVPGDAGVRTPADLRGKTIGVDGSDSTSAYLDTMLRNVGRDPARDVHSVNVGFNLLPALLGGKVDAIAGGFQNIEGAAAQRRRRIHPGMRVCVICGRGFTPKRSDADYCSSACKQRAYRAGLRRSAARGALK
jgi:putative hydroxymethylpyrimidine transport system substrate-binding protein